jgi:hypothetical protein
MVIEKDSRSDEVLPVEQVQRVGDYFKSLFVRSLTLNLDDGSHERWWKPQPAPAADTSGDEAAPGKAQDERGGTD